MARRCTLTGKGVQSGHLVSHSNIKTKTKFKPNLQQASLISDCLGMTIKLRISTNALRSIEVNGGLDNYLISTSSRKLTPEAVSIKKKIKKALAQQDNAQG